MLIRNGPSNENVPPLSPILPSIRITSRVTPTGKVAFVNSIANEKGVIVGMCGDGGNDCGLRTKFYDLKFFNEFNLFWHESLNFAFFLPTFLS